MTTLNKPIESKVYCKKDCVSLGGAKFFANKSYKCDIIGYTYFMYDLNGEVLRLEKYTNYIDITFSDLFYTEQELRKQKLKNLNESRR